MRYNKITEKRYGIAPIKSGGDLMIIIFSAAPILIGLAVVGLALLSGLQSCMDVITKIAWTAVIVISVGMTIYNLFRKSSVKDKIAGTLISVGATVIALFESKAFLSAFADSDHSGLLELIGFGFTLFVGGALWLACIGLCVFAIYNCFENDYGDGSHYLASVLSALGSAALWGILGLFG